jgi:hypothetical protein
MTWLQIILIKVSKYFLRFSSNLPWNRPLPAPSKFLHIHFNAIFSDHSLLLLIYDDNSYSCSVVRIKMFSIPGNMRMELDVVK